ncbi:hypothetical protein [Amycolatopsis orientalis]|uniref:hypothetical protein n=1 Tax=Amycolatopsis orientalis TaxID=31958 RepID=UPI001268215D|nr:hypothetical protein [Amycolatopsis orientalis]
MTTVPILSAQSPRGDSPPWHHTRRTGPLQPHQPARLDHLRRRHTLFTASYDTLDQTQPDTITEITGAVTTSHAFTRTAIGVSRTVVNGAGRLTARPPP